MFPQDYLHAFLPFLPFYINYSQNVTWSSPFSQTTAKIALRRVNDWVVRKCDGVPLPRMPRHSSVAVASVAAINVSTPVKS